MRPNSIKTWKEEERPREKLMLQGAAALSDSELLAILIGSGTRTHTAVDLSRNLLAESGGRLAELARKSARQLIATPGVGLAKATSILATFELARRLAAELPEDELTIRTSETVARMMAPHLRDIPHEECWAIYLNRGHKLIGKEKVSVGGMGSTIIDIKIIVKKAVERLSSALIVVHNHPSGNPLPGEQDRVQTEALKRAAAVFDIELVDHVIIGRKKYYSFSDDAASAW